jgi:CheY-like chemotaxis protein
MLQCFVSYSSKDRVMVEDLVRRIKAVNRYKVWFDQQSIRGGDAWEKEIHQAIAKSDVCLVVLTPDSIESPWVKKEIQESRQISNPVIPLHMRQINIPDDLEKLGIADLQVIDFLRDGSEIGDKKLFQRLSDLQAQPNSSTHLRALIIEDDPSHQAQVKNVLSSQDIETLIAGDKDAALDWVRNQAESFDLITLDMQLTTTDLGGFDGKHLLDQLQMWRPHTPVIIISALDFKPGDVSDFLREYHAFAFLEKPVNPKKLREAVEVVLGRKRG